MSHRKVVRFELKLKRLAAQGVALEQRRTAGFFLECRGCSGISGADGLEEQLWLAFWRPQSSLALDTHEGPEALYQFPVAAVTNSISVVLKTTHI